MELTSRILQLSHTKKIALAAIVFSGMIFGLAYLFNLVSTKHSGTYTDVYVRAGYYPYERLYEVDPETTTLTPVSLTVKGVEYMVSDMVRAENGTQYYIGNDPLTTTQSTIFMQTPDSVVVPVTISETIKRNLDYSAIANALVYEVVPQATASSSSTESNSTDVPPLATITEFNLETRTEQEIGLGNNPRFTKQGATLLVSTGTGIGVLVPGDATSTSTPIIEYSGGAYDINTAATYAAFINYQTSAIDVFAVTNTTTLDYTYSATVPSTVASVSFAGDMLVYAEKISSVNNSVTYALRGLSRAIDFSLPETAPLQDILIITHD